MMMPSRGMYRDHQPSGVVHEHSRQEQQYYVPGMGRSDSRGHQGSDAPPPTTDLKQVTDHLLSTVDVFRLHVENLTQVLRARSSAPDSRHLIPLDPDFMYQHSSVLSNLREAIGNKIKLVEMLAKISYMPNATKHDNEQLNRLKGIISAWEEFGVVVAEETGCKNMMQTAIHNFSIQTTDERRAVLDQATSDFMTSQEETIMFLEAYLANVRNFHPTGPPPNPGNLMHH
uniref:Uncharacterized protein n=1 Tax=Hemiselmis andersenii TaxID=464988 RepID=A0A7S0TKY8_HEMAN|mmetsp:Transcript_17005/g.39337  ORF Transcript_17005/g.39337 Transcript_17005/m.39337 type:complete len:229 (+) Transcript_17005:236-922(+)